MHVLTRLFAIGLCAAAAASAVQAQTTRGRTLGAAPAAAANRTPSLNSQATQVAPNPAGLRPPFPAGVSSGSGAAVSNDPIARSTSPVPPAGSIASPGTGTGTGTNTGNNGNGTGTNDGGLGNTPVVPATNVLGAGATVRGPAQSFAGAGGFSATDEARSFFFADANKDGELTRAEAGRLSISTLPFEEMDRNFDGVITRFEYQDSLR